MPRATQAVIENDELVIRLPINRPPYPESSSGKTLIVASTSGNIRTGVVLPMGDGTTRELVLGLNAYVYKEAR